ncbi:hypothetical protein MBLNU230_g4932t1 [Neophaeotheca triangularis]
MTDRSTPSSGPHEDSETYYASLPDNEAQEAFRNLDDHSVLDACLLSIESPQLQTFVLDFGPSNAHVALDLSVRATSALLSAPRPESLSTRWINIWQPVEQIPLLHRLAQQYDLSPRLLALMCSDPKQGNHPAPSSLIHSQKRSWRWHRRTAAPTPTPSIGKGSDELSEHTSISSHEMPASGNLYKVVDEIWHYSSVDFGRNFVCLGFNSLYGTKPQADGDDFAEQQLPHCTRIWSWLLLCSDNTIISIQEDPFPFARKDRLSAAQQRILCRTRCNLLNIFRSLSAVSYGPLAAQNPMTLLPIRTRLGSTPEESAHRNSDAPGLLFYYLFENWHNSYTLVTRKDSRYGHELATIRREMFSRPTLSHIDRLHRVGEELGVLRRHYQSYNRIIDRLLEPRVATSASLENSRVVSEGSRSSSMDTIRPAMVTEKDSLLGVSLSSAARVRFKRLKDLIDLYALSEVQEYLQQKENLVSMNFSLIAHQQNLSVDRLTRVTLLLTKASILFLPVSFVSGYFSINFDESRYTIPEYWVSFAVIFVLSWASLFVFGALSGTMETRVIWRSLRGCAKAGWGWVKRAVGGG